MPVTLASRYAIAKKYINGLNYIVKRLKCSVNDPGYRAYVSAFAAQVTIKWESDIAEPVAAPDGRWGIRRTQNPDILLSIIPLKKEDTQVHPHFKELLGRVTYRETEKAIYLPYQKIHKVWRGLLLFHEVSHFMAHDEGRHRRKNKQSDYLYWKEEFEAYYFEALGARHLLGADYNELVDTYAKKLILQLKPRAKRSTAIHYNKVPVHELRKVLGKPLSKLEANVQYGLANLDMAYRAFDVLYPDHTSTKSFKEHIAFTRHFCSPPKTQKSKAVL